MPQPARQAFIPTRRYYGTPMNHDNHLSLAPATGRHRLDRFISRSMSVPMREVRRLIAVNSVTVNGQPALAANQLVNQFSRVDVGGVRLPFKVAAYWMLNKPKGVVSATKDEKNPTVLDLLSHTGKDELHIAGRLDFNSTGLILLSNDGHWTRGISLPGSGLSKRYRVRVEHPITDDCVRAFADGMYFETEGIHTRSAELIRLGSREAQVVLSEGKYHQIKRMFGRFGNPVLKLHREAVGAVALDEQLAFGDARPLQLEEVAALSINSKA